MPTYVAFLRAINLGARRKFGKDDVRAATQAAGFSDVDTYLNTGNVRVSTRMRSLARIEAALEEAFLANRGFEVPTIVFGLPELAEVSAYAVQLAERTGPLERHYISLLREPLAPAVAAQVEAASGPVCSVVVHGRAVSMMWPHATPGDVDALGPALSRTLGLTTARTSRVLSEIVRRWG